MLRLLAMLVCSSPLLAFEPDPATVRRHGPAYRYPQAGWIVLHIEGEPWERGFQHGTLMSREIADYVQSLAVQQSKADPVSAWNITRTLVNALFVRKFDREYLEEMQGIAAGANAAGALFDKRPLDLIDIVCINMQMEYETLDNAIDATPHGLEGVKFPQAAAKSTTKEQVDHCSAFAATGPATADGKLVIGHITMSGLANALASNVWLDVKSAKGHRVVMQGFPGAIWSAQDYYMNSKGLILTETTIRQTRFNAEGTPLTQRCRKAMQYGNTIDDVVKSLTENNNGLYTNEWLIGDANTNEIAMLELGTSAHKLHRSSKNEWILKGTEGFYWGCNNTKDLKVRADSGLGLPGRPQDLTWRPSDRDKAWLRLYDQHRGKVDEAFAKKAFAMSPLAGKPSLDAKFTTADMAKKLQSHAVFGPPSGRLWEVTQREHDKYHSVRSLVPNDWTVIGIDAKAEWVKTKPVDFEDKLPEKIERPHTEAAWHGTLLPKTDEDVWLTAGFAAYERIVALEKALKAKTPKLSPEVKEFLELEFFPHEVNLMYQGLTGERYGTVKDTSLIFPMHRDVWYRHQVALGVTRLRKVRAKLGVDQFIELADRFGRDHHGKAVSTEDFLSAFKVKMTDMKDELPEGMSFKTPNPFDPFTRPRDTLDNMAPSLPLREYQRIVGVEPAFLPTSVTGWMDDPEHTIIVYGTAHDAAGNKAAAYELQKRFRVKWWNGDIPVMSDTDADGKWKDKHVILIGRPYTQAIQHKYNLPAKFDSHSTVVNGKTYAHERTAIITAGANPFDWKFSLVVVAGHSADATFHAAQALPGLSPAPIYVSHRGEAPLPMLIKK